MLLRSKNVVMYYYLFSQKKIYFAVPLKENKKIFAKQIRRFRIRENMSRTCHNKVTVN